MKSNYNKDDAAVISEIKKATSKDVKDGQVKITVAGIPCEYFYDQSLGRFELQDISFNGIYAKIPQIIPEGQTFDIRFALKLHGPIYWAHVAVSKTYETNVYLEFIEIPYITKKKIEHFIDEISERNIHRLLKPYNTPKKN
jgi:hypothetical protein